MRTSLECMSCFVRQGLHAVRLVSDDESVHEQVLREVLRHASGIDLKQSPVEMGQYIHRCIRYLTGEDDPYAATKQRFNQEALRLLPKLRTIILESDCPLETAVRIAIAGNIIDFGVRSDIDEEAVHASLEHALTTPISKEAFAAFQDQAEHAERILYLADNAGEIVFDRLLLEQLPTERVVVAVKASPVINDATMADARTAGITDRVEVIDNGDDAPGTVLENCAADFIQRFKQADMIIAKGQGNYESLNEVEAPVFFLLKAKCAVVADDLGCNVGDLILHQQMKQMPVGI